MFFVCSRFKMEQQITAGFDGRNLAIQLFL
jgi:hypothetical protein